MNLENCFKFFLIFKKIDHIFDHKTNFNEFKEFKSYKIILSDCGMDANL